MSVLEWHIVVAIVFVVAMAIVARVACWLTLYSPEDQQ